MCAYILIYNMCIYIYIYVYMYVYICIISFIGNNFIYSVLNVFTFYTHKRYFVCVVQIISV